MKTRDKAVAGGAGGFTVLFGLGAMGVDPLTAVFAGVLAVAGSLEPTFAEVFSVASNSITAVGIASDGLSIQPLLESLPTKVLNPVSVFILTLAVIALAFRIKED